MSKKKFGIGTVEVNDRDIRFIIVKGEKLYDI